MIKMSKNISFLSIIQSVFMSESKMKESLSLNSNRRPRDWLPPGVKGHLPLLALVVISTLEPTTVSRLKPYRAVNTFICRHRNL